MISQLVNQVVLIYFVSGSITVELTSYFTGLELIKQVKQLNPNQITHTVKPPPEDHGGGQMAFYLHQGAEFETG